MSRRHELKTWGSYFDDVRKGDKNFEVRKNDRDYQVEDILSLVKFDPASGDYSYDDAGNKVRIDRQVTYVLHGGQFGIKPGYVVLGLRDPPSTPAG